MIETQLENIHAVLVEIRDLIKKETAGSTTTCTVFAKDVDPDTVVKPIEPAKKRDKKGTNETPEKQPDLDTEVTPEPEPEKQSDPATETPTLDQLRDLGKRITEAGKFAEAKEWIRSKDATSLQTLSPDQYSAFAEFAKTLLA